jgi:Peptidase M50B-like
VFSPLLEYFTLFYGVFLGYYACKDIWDDVVTRDSEGSDAQACHLLYPCCLPRCVGVQFLIVGVAFQFVGLYLGLVWLINTNS